MIEKCLLTLLFVCDAVINQVSSIEYPCDNRIMFVIEDSDMLHPSVFRKQINFLSNKVFNDWTYFEQLAIVTRSTFNDADVEFGAFKSISEVKNYIQGIEQTSADPVCSIFGYLDDGKYRDAQIIMFLSELHLSDIRDDCLFSLRKIFLKRKSSIMFVPLSGNFNRTVMRCYFKQAKILEWDVKTNKTPADWKEHFDEFYNCKGPEATTIKHSIETTTEGPVNQYPSCDSKITITFDKSSNLNKQEFQGMKDFLVSHVFKNWTRFDNLDLFSFDSHYYSTVMPFKDINELESFIRDENQSDESNADFCNLFYRFSVREDPIVIFLSNLNETDFEVPRYWYEKTCQKVVNKNFDTHITFVLLNDKVNIDVLRQHIPLAQIIKLDLSDPVNWKWNFLTAYQCNKGNNDLINLNDANDKTMYPCNEKFIFGYDVSSELNVLDSQRDFLKEHVFNKDWNVFNNLALVAYSNNTIIRDFGTLNSLTEVHDFIDESFNQNASRTSLCSLFKDLTEMYLFDVNVILFANSFHDNVNDECPLLIKQIRENVNSINFIMPHKQNDYLLSHFPQAIFTSWDPTTSKMPEKWEGVEVYGCQNFFVNVKEYPCHADLNNIRVVYDRSHYLTPFAYQRLLNFLLKRVFIKQWIENDNSDVGVYNYPDNKKCVSPFRMEEKLFILQSLQINEEPLFCPGLKKLADKDALPNLLFFVSKFDESNVLINSECKQNINTINECSKTTFIKLDQRVKESLILEIFPNATIVNWNIEEDEEFANWNEILWTAFGCAGGSPIILPVTSTVGPSTLKTTPVEIKRTPTVLTSSTTKTTTQISTTTTTSYSTPTITATTHSKPPIALIAALSVLSVLIVLILIGGIAGFFWYQKRQRGQMIDNMVFGASTGDSYEYGRNRVEEEDLWRIDTERVEYFVDKKLGSGASASVFLGKLTGISGISLVYPNVIALRHFHDCDVAIKVLPFYATESNKDDFKQEINFMKKLGYNQHIICLLGYTTEQIVLEYCENGDLMNFLKKNRDTFESNDIENSLKLKDLIGFAWQIANGMEYFSSLELVHRDLAARNVLLTKDRICKVSDFGLAREGNLQSYTSKRRMPVRWLPIEVLKDFLYSMKSDVWSYGVLLYEVFTLGEFPYSNLENEEILHFIESGSRLEQPEHASGDLYSIMTSCWSAVPDERPTFTEICQKLVPLLELFNVDYNYVSPVEETVETNIHNIFETESEEVAI